MSKLMRMLTLSAVGIGVLALLSADGCKRQKDHYEKNQVPAKNKIIQGPTNGYAQITNVYIDNKRQIKTINAPRYAEQLNATQSVKPRPYNK